jgi:hypothetical protein
MVNRAALHMSRSLVGFHVMSTLPTAWSAVKSAFVVTRR